MGEELGEQHERGGTETGMMYGMPPVLSGIRHLQEKGVRSS
jgi:hypothetical protein